MKGKLILALSFFGAVFFLSGCGSRVSGPAQVKLAESVSNLTRKNLERISRIILPNPYRFRFAVVSDSHVDYADLTDMVNDVNRDSTVSFLIHAGDFTDLGWLTEYYRTEEILSTLSIPYLTVIGNHDALTGGRQVYVQMFGDFDYSLVFYDCKFIFLDANSPANLGNPPDLGWLEDELSGSDRYRLIFVIAHQPPFDPAWSDETESRYKQLMEENNVSLSIHGHEHYFYYGDEYQDGVRYLVVDAASHRNYCIVSVDSTAFGVERVDLDR
ncbi:MAG: metallophosphoesterase [Candidatus Zixiibacteriota bacterium]